MCVFIVKLLPPAVNLKIRLSRNVDNFTIMADTLTYKIKVLDLKLSFRKVRVSDSVTLRHIQQFKTSVAQYPFHKTKITTHTVPSDVSSIEIQSIATGPLPQQV